MTSLSDRYEKESMSLLSVVNLFLDVEGVEGYFISSFFIAEDISNASGFGNSSFSANEAG